jgi:hypothetical protein
MEYKLHWEDLPPRQYRGLSKETLALLSMLARKPGKWARIRKVVHSDAATRYNRQHPAYEFATRRVNGSRFLYGRAKPKKKIPKTTKRRKG